MYRDRLDKKNWQLEGVQTLGLVLLATFAVRLYLFLNTPVIAQDATLYLGQAQLIAQGAWQQAFRYEFEPLFPIFIFLFHSILPDWELAGKMASLTFGVLAIVPFFLISRDVFGPRAAFGAGILFALHPYFARHSAEALTEPAYLFFFLLSLWLALKALKSPGMKLYLFCALAILITWLSRGEGIWLFPALFLFFGLRSMSDRPNGKWGGITPLLRLSLAFLTVMIPVTVYGIQSGNLSRLLSLKGFEWLMSVVRQIPVFLQAGLARLGSVAVGGEVAGDLWEGYIREFIEAFHPLLLLLAILPLGRKALRSHYRDYFLLTLSVTLIYLGGVFIRWLALGKETVSHRYMLAPVVVALPWVAVAIEMVAARMKGSKWSERWLAPMKKWSVIGHRSSDTGNQWGTIILVVIALILAAKTVKPQRLDKLPIKEAGIWIAAQELKDPVIMTRDSRIAFYANGRMLPVIDALKSKKAHAQLSIVQKLIRQATSKKAQFIFLKGSLNREVQTTILASGAVDRIKEWPNRYGNVYTLIQVEGSAK